MKTTYSTLVLGLLAGAVNAQTTHVADFKQTGVGFLHGAILHGDEFNSRKGGFKFEVTTNSNSQQSTPTNTAIIFDTRETNTADPDLEDAFVGGNLKGQILGDVLIFAENLTDKNNDGLVDRPDDNQNGGVLTIKFNESNVSEFGFALVDAPETRESFNITFYSSTQDAVSLSFDEYIAVSGTTGFVAGNNHANQFANTSARDLGLSNIQLVEIDLRASGGIDNITYTEGAIPEPSTALLSLIGLGFIARRRR